MYKRWLKALESGQYTELININLLGFRRVGNKYTALGVLIDINQHLGYHWIKVNEDYIVVSDKNPNNLSPTWIQLGFDQKLISRIWTQLGSKQSFKVTIAFLKKEIR